MKKYLPNVGKDVPLNQKVFGYYKNILCSNKLDKYLDRVTSVLEFGSAFVFFFFVMCWRPALMLPFVYLFTFVYRPPAPFPRFNMTGSCDFLFCFLSFFFFFGFINNLQICANLTSWSISSTNGWMSDYCFFIFQFFFWGGVIKS